MSLECAGIVVVLFHCNQELPPLDLYHVEGFALNNTLLEAESFTPFHHFKSKQLLKRNK